MKWLIPCPQALYEQGNIKVLIIDPDNATAKRYLQKMGLGKVRAEKPKALEDSLQTKDDALAKVRPDSTPDSVNPNMPAQAIEEPSSP